MNQRNGLPQLSERHLAMLAEMGVSTWWTQGQGQPDEVAPVVAVAPPPAKAEKPVAAPARPARVAEQAPAAPAPPRPVVAWAQADHGTLSQAVEACTACDLAQHRHRAVVGMGDLHPDWLVVGEAPGEEEDRQGLPFVGRAGQLLDKMLHAMGLNRERGVYIANVIKCRPPHNRNPDPAEVAQCTPYLLRQIELLQPKIVLAMGRFAAQTVLGQGGCMPTDALLQMPLGKLRGRVFQAQLGKMSLPVVVTYHPAYLLRSPAEKAKAWADLCLAMDARERL
jgi:DNA polymerase